MVDTPSVVLLTTYPPRQCGISTFASDLLHSFQLISNHTFKWQVAAVNRSIAENLRYPSEVRWQINAENKSDFKKLARLVNHKESIKAVIIQHEFGIFGPHYGRNVLSFCQSCRKPFLITFHTVMPAQYDPRINLTEAEYNEIQSNAKTCIELASVVIVLTEKSKETLSLLSPENKDKIKVIPHGIHPVSFVPSQVGKKNLQLTKKTILTTFGFLSRGKGIEYVIKALPPVVKLYPHLLYLILGETHPDLQAYEGEKYRHELVTLIKKLKLTKNVKFYNQYLDLKEILSFLQATDIYVSTSTNPDQAVSGTFSYAVGSGRAVISTDFVQAHDIITPEIGRLVPVKDTAGYTSAFLDLLSRSNELTQMGTVAYRQTRSMLWSNTALHYLRLVAAMTQSVSLVNFLLPPLNLRHLKRLTNQFALYQFARLSRPDPRFGYTLDDNVRALIATCYLASNPAEAPLANRLAKTYVNFIAECQQPDGFFANYITKKGEISDQNNRENLEDAFSRTIWALGQVIHCRSLNHELIEQCRQIWQSAFSHINELTYPHSRAYAIKGLALASLTSDFDYHAIVKEQADWLVNQYRSHVQESWHWFSDELNYANGVFPEALLLAYEVTKNADYLTVARESLDFLLEISFWGDIYVPVGQKGWYRRGQSRALFDQQPEEACSLILALDRIYQITSDPRYREFAIKSFSWFLGNNLLGLPLYDRHTGGCNDGLMENGVNSNQGAESLVSYLISHLTIDNLLK